MDTGASTLATGQRGVARPQDSAADIGAFECPSAANPGQADFHGDGLGDACDPDDDTVNDVDDAFPFDQTRAVLCAPG